MNVSVVIPTFNNAKMLATTLAAFEHVVFPEKTELIVVDNNSKDTTKETIISFSDRLPIKYVFEKKQGISAAKNAGISLARGRLLIFTDDDVRPCSAWIKSYWSAYTQDNKKLYWGGPIESEFDGPKPDASLLRFAPPSVRGLDLGTCTRLLEPNEWFVGANIAVSADTFNEMGGFDTTLGLDPSTGIVSVGEESDLQRRLKLAGYRAMYLPDASLRHVVPHQKSSLKHIADRAEACGRYMKAISTETNEGRTFRGLPLWRYRKCAERWLSAWMKRMTGRDWYPDYISFRADLGFIRGDAGNKGSSSTKILR
ncbi:MAG: glycosyltransferase [Candidatus Vecturithrix sp.]|jgi:glycosyltransferase involved in cell wall biosynthesis|nr:glycosyltransferase [Candidatus Vecturithrix sp.]